MRGGVTSSRIVERVSCRLSRWVSIIRRVGSDCKNILGDLPTYPRRKVLAPFVLHFDSGIICLRPAKASLPALGIGGSGASYSSSVSPSAS